MDVFAEVRAIVRANPNSFQETLEFIESHILRSEDPPSPAAIQKAFLELWRDAWGNTLILIAWLLSDTEIKQGGPSVSPVLAGAILDHFEGDDSADPLTLQEWIMGYIFWPDRSEKRLKNAIDAYKPLAEPEGNTENTDPDALPYREIDFSRRRLIIGEKTWCLSGKEFDFFKDLRFNREHKETVLRNSKFDRGYTPKNCMDTLRRKINPFDVNSIIISNTDGYELHPDVKVNYRGQEGIRPTKQST